MSAQDTHVTVPNGHRMRARWFLPERPNGLNAAVVVIHDIFGFSDDQARIAQRLADNGYPAPKACAWCAPCATTKPATATPSTSSTPAGNGCWNKPISRSPRWP